jgi:hypothetical protein
MGKILQIGNYGVYIFDERGSPHHLPHAHIKGRRGRQFASVFLLSLELFNVVEDPGPLLVEGLQAQQHTLLSAWEELNND